MALNNLAAARSFSPARACATGGRVRHHLLRHLDRSDSSVIFVGFAAEGTLARQIIDGARAVTIFGENIAVRAHIHTINGFSAHADQAELLAWRAHANPRRTFLVHGEETAMQALKEKIGAADVIMPELGQSFEL